MLPASDSVNVNADVCVDVDIAIAIAIATFLFLATLWLPILGRNHKRHICAIMCSPHQCPNQQNFL